MGHHLECGENEMNVHIDLLLKMGKVQRCRLADLFHLFCTSWFVGSRIARALAEYGYSRRSVRHDAGCGGNEVSIRRALQLAVKENQEVRNKQSVALHSGSYLTGSQ